MISMDHFIGIDLGSHVDYSAVSLLERSIAIRRDGLPMRDTRGFLLYRWRLRGLYRFPLRTPYPVIAAKVARIASMGILRSAPRVCVDSTGVGVPILEMIRAACEPYEGVEVWGCSITGGEAWRVVGRHQLNCSKVQLVGALKAVLEDERFKLAWRVDGSMIRGASVLRAELRAFKVRMTQARNETFGGEGAHDDCVLSISLPVLVGSLPFIQMREELAGADPGVFQPKEAEALKVEAEEKEARRREEEKEARRRREAFENVYENEFWWETGMWYP
jgi:hypothetical protein